MVSNGNLSPVSEDPGVAYCADSCSVLVGDRSTSSVGDLSTILGYTLNLSGDESVLMSTSSMPRGKHSSLNTVGATSDMQVLYPD